MKNYLPKSVNSHLKTMAAAALLAVGSQAAHAQGLTFGTLYSGDPVNGSSNLSTNQVLRITAGTGAEYVKPAANPSFLTTDLSGNIAVGFNGGNRISRVDNGSNTMTVFFANIGCHSIKIDRDDEYIYYAGLAPSIPAIYRSVWKNSGANTSVGFYSASPAATSTAAVRQIPFLNNGDMVYFNGSTSLSAYAFGQVRAMAFDAAGNLFYADFTNNVIRKISIIKKSVTADMAVGSTLTLTDVANIKVGSIVRGINIASSTYVGSVNPVTNEITLTTSDLTTPKLTTGIVSNTASLAFIVGVDHIAGTFGTASTTAVTLGGAAGTTPLSFNASSYGIGLAFDANGNLFVTDQTWSRVVKIAATSGLVNSNSIISEFVSGTSISNSTAGLAFDSNNKLYITKRAVHTFVRTTSTAGQVETVAGSSGRQTIASYTTTSGSTTLTAVTPASVTALNVGMILRGTGLASGTKVVAKDVNTNTVTISIAATASGTSTNAIVTTEDGYVTPGVGTTNTGSIDGPAGIVIVNDKIYIAESTGSYVRVLSGVSTLPITLAKAFNAKANTNGTVDLSWSTASETDNNRFIIKRSTDGVTFTEIKSLPSAGETGSSYSFTDLNPLNGTSYYQLSQIDNDGTTKELGIRTVNFSLKNATFSIYPNPVTERVFSINVLAITTSSVIVKIANIAGENVFTKTYPKSSNGIYAITLPENMTSGIYVISVNNTNGQKLIIK